MNFWGRPTPAEEVAASKRILADQIVAASGGMPDEGAHKLWLVTLDLRTLQERLAQIRQEGQFYDRCRRGRQVPVAEAA